MSYTSDREISRRRFLTASAAGLLAAGMPEWFVRQAQAAELERQSGQPRKIGPNDTIQVGAIGVGGRKGGYQQGLGDTHRVGEKQGVKVIAICDLDDVHRDDAAAQFGPDTKKYHDYRELLASKDIDAVVIGTPDHWHVPVCMAALKAGKDIYCEKPLTLTIGEGHDLVQTWKKSNRMFQTGSQQRSEGPFYLACQLVRNGRIGKIKSVNTFLPTGPTGGPFMPQTPPTDLDFDFWLGQAAQADYFPERCHGNFRWFLDYSGGMLTDWGAHHHDIAQWGLGVDRSGPISVEQVSSTPPKAGPDAKNYYTTYPAFKLKFTYPDGTTLISTNEGENGVEFVGELGSIFVSRGRIGGYTPDGTENKKLIDEPLPADAKVQLYHSTNHAQNFVDGIRSRKQPICDAEIGHRSASVCHLANICLRTGGSKLTWDPQKETFTGEGAKAANSHLRRKPRDTYLSKYKA